MIKKAIVKIEDRKQNEGRHDKYNIQKNKVSGKIRMKYGE